MKGQKKRKGKKEKERRKEKQNWQRSLLLPLSLPPSEFLDDAKKKHLQQVPVLALGVPLMSLTRLLKAQSQAPASEGLETLEGMLPVCLATWRQKTATQTHERAS